MFVKMRHATLAVFALVGMYFTAEVMSDDLLFTSQQRQEQTDDSFCDPETQDAVGCTCTEDEAACLECNTCVCREGSWQCTRMFCMVDDDSLPWTLIFGECVQFDPWNQDFEVDNQQQSNDILWEPFTQEQSEQQTEDTTCDTELQNVLDCACTEGDTTCNQCNMCTCNGGYWVCTLIGCLVIDNSLPWKLDSGRCVQYDPLNQEQQNQQQDIKLMWEPFIRGRDQQQSEDIVCDPGLQKVIDCSCTDGESECDKCNTCACKGGIWVCSQMFCMDYDESLPWRLESGRCVQYEPMW